MPLQISEPCDLEYTARWREFYRQIARLTDKEDPKGLQRLLGQQSEMAWKVGPEKAEEVFRPKLREALGLGAKG